MITYDKNSVVISNAEESKEDMRTRVGLDSELLAQQEGINYS